MYVYIFVCVYTIYIYIHTLHICIYLCVYIHKYIWDIYIHILDKTDIKTKTNKRQWRGLYNNKGKIKQKCITFANTYAPNIEVHKYTNYITKYTKLIYKIY